MVEASNVRLPLDAGLSGKAGEAALRDAVARALGVGVRTVEDVRLLKRSVDARKKGDVHFVATVAVRLAEGVEVRPVRGVNVKEHVPFPKLRIPDCAAAARDAGVVRFAEDEGAKAASDGSRARTAAEGFPDDGASDGNPSGDEGAAPLRRPVVVGAGPAGLFAALYLAEAGLRPLLVERGAAVEERQRAVDDFAAGGSLDVQTNIQFGEGGAGTFSDGKLTTGTKSPHIRHVLQAFVEAGAPEEILWQAKPHIGTDKLPGVVRGIRERIVAAGGEVRFATQLVGIEVRDGAVAGVSLRARRPRAQGAATGGAVRDAADGAARFVVGDASSPTAPDSARSAAEAAVARGMGAGGESESKKHASTSAENSFSADEECSHTNNPKSDYVTYRMETNCVILACGHSARDTFELVRDLGAPMERKPFAMGVRIEHDQRAIDRAQYGAASEHPALGAADYKLAVHLPDGRGVYTFCMCPGGEVVAAASEEGGVCVNGMSRFARDGANANSALLVEVRPDDFADEGPLAAYGDEGVLAGVALQRAVERAAYRVGMSDGARPYTAPAQRIGDFLANAAQPDACGEGAKVRKADACRCAAGAAVSAVAADGSPSASVFRADARAESDAGASVAPTASAAVPIPTYPRGVAWCDLRDVLPPFMADALAEALPLLDRKLRGFADASAVLTAVEARSSSPVRIVRDDAFQSDVRGLYPCGEGAGYAGGIMSAAVDGLRVAESLCERIRSAAEE